MNGQLIGLDDYENFVVSPSTALSPAFLSSPKGFPILEQLPTNAEKSNFHCSLVAQLDNAAKAGGVIKKAVGELCKPKCQQIALYGSYALAHPFVWPHVAEDQAAPCSRAYVRVSEDGLIFS